MVNITKFNTDTTNNISDSTSKITDTCTSTITINNTYIIDNTIATTTTTATASATDTNTTTNTTTNTLSSTHNYYLNSNNIYNVKSNSNANNIENTNTCINKSISKYKQISCVKNIEKPWKFVYQNIQSLISDNSRIKIDYFNEYIVENKIAIFNFTETWLTDTIKDETKIVGYNIFRGDRNEIKQGGWLYTCIIVLMEKLYQVIVKTNVIWQLLN